MSEAPKDLDFKVCGFRLTNSGPFIDTQWVEIAPSITFVVGANNAGKSSVLRGITSQSAGGHILGSETNIGLGLRFTADMAAARILLEENTGIWIPRPQANMDRAVAVNQFREHLNRSKEFVVERIYTNGNAGAIAYPSSPYASAPSQWEFHHPRNQPSQAPHNLISRLSIAIQEAYGRIRLLDAGRTDFSTSPDTGATEIGRGGESLATALARRQSNAPKYRAFMDLVRRVIPDVTWIQARTSSNQATLWSCLEEPSEDNEPRLLPLAACGAGVGHVLAIIYLAFYERNTTLLIDEPQAYLHPSACRELVRVFKSLDNHGHRYIIATHSTAMLSEAMPVSVLEVKRTAHVSVINTTSATSMRSACALLPTVGARWSDVFGPDQIVWVEGDTEAACFSAILQTSASQRSVTFVPLRATGDLKGKNIDKALYAVSVYNRLSQHLSLVARKCTIILDNENLTPDEQADIRAKFPRGTLVFTGFAMYEQLLLRADAISARLHLHMPEFPIADLSARVAGLLTAQEGNVNSADVISRVFQTASDSTVEYRKVEDGLALTMWILEHDENALKPTRSFLENVIDPKYAAARS